MVLFLLAVCFLSFATASSYHNQIDSSPPCAPELIAIVDDMGRATLTWNVVDSATGFRVYADHALGKSFDGSFEHVWEFGLQTSVTIDLWAGADVYYAVTAYNAEGESGFSSIIRVGLPPETPSLTLVEEDEYAVLTWSRSAGATGYRVYADQSRAAPFDGFFDFSWDFRVNSARVKLWTGANVYYAVTAYNALGESDFSEIVRLFPSPVNKDWASIATGDSHSVALKTDGSLWVWGWNRYGQLGDGTCTDYATPDRIGEDKDWAAVFAGGDQSFAIKDDGTLWGWGANYRGQLGDGTRENRHVPTQIGTDSNWAALSTELHNTVAVKTDGTLWAWGNMSWCLGPCDIGEYDELFPVRIGQDSDWMDVSASDVFAVALKSDHTIWAWGGRYLYYSKTYPEPVQIGDDADWASVSAGDRHVVALKMDRSLWTWGWSFYGVLGNGVSGIDKTELEPLRITTDNDWAFVRGGNTQTFAIKEDGTLWAWGKNSKGALADGTVIDRSIPTLTDFGGRWRKIATGRDHYVGMQRDGTLWAWGKDDHGELGAGLVGIERGDEPIQIEKDNLWRSAATGCQDFLAIDSDGALWIWNQVFYSSVDSTFTFASPFWSGNDSSWSTASTGAHHVAAIKSDGTLWAWGKNYHGQIGDGTYEDRIRPVRIGSGSDWNRARTGANYTVALKEDGTLWAWGNNSRGNLGEGTTEVRNFPVQVGLDDDWVMAVASLGSDSAHTVALKADGTLWAWGYNVVGQLGDGTTQDQYYPVQVGNDSDWTSVEAGLYHTVAIKEDHSLWAWGQGWDINPRRVGDSKDWQEVSAGCNYTVGIKLDGTLWNLGNSYLTETGEQSQNWKQQPVQVGTDSDWESVSSTNWRSFVLALKRGGTLWALGNFCYAIVNPTQILVEACQQ